jgi:hypothetical protein
MLKKKNFAKSTLASGITAAATQLTVATGEGTKFPSSGKFRAVLWAASYTNPSDDPNTEIVEAELNTGDTFDITRGKEGTSGHAWSASDNFAHTITAETMEEIEDEITQRPAFSVHRNGTNQTGITSGDWTKVRFTTEEFDTNGDFEADADDSGGASESRFTPTVAGKYLLTAAIAWDTDLSERPAVCAICKNGTLYKQIRIIHATSVSGVSQSHPISVIVDANGSTDYFEVYCWQNFTNAVLDGASDKTFFSGCRIA